MVAKQGAGISMTGADRINSYVEKARSVGSCVELVSPEALTDRLRSLCDSLARQASSGRDSEVGEVGACDGAAPPEAEEGFLVALPTNGWPSGLKENVAAALASFGCRLVSPQPEDGGYGWNRGLLAKALLGVTYCRTFLAETGSLVVPSGPGMGTLATLLPPIHLALSHPDGCRANLADHLADLEGSLPSRLTLITGPSRTGDIEASMTKGVHGPREVHHWILV